MLKRVSRKDIENTKSKINVDRFSSCNAPIHISLLSGRYGSKVTFSGSLDVEKIAKTVFLYVFILALTASLLS